MKKVIAGKIKPQLRLDGYYNVLNKYGTQHDSTEYYQWATGAAVTDAELADLYAGNGLFSTIIDAPADDATKNGIDLGNRGGHHQPYKGCKDQNAPSVFYRDHHRRRNRKRGGTVPCRTTE